MKLPVLFTQSGSNYDNYKCFDTYDFERNALTYNGSSAVICHPPCRSWGRLRGLAYRVPAEHWLAVWSVLKIRKLGGVLEHPAGSTLWKFCKLPYPGQAPDIYGGFSISINQHWFGFEAEKNTWLYVCGCELKDIPPVSLNFSAVTHVVNSVKASKVKKELSKNKRALTPVDLCFFLAHIILTINEKKGVRL